MQLLSTMKPPRRRTPSPDRPGNLEPTTRSRRKFLTILNAMLRSGTDGDMMLLVCKTPPKSDLIDALARSRLIIVSWLPNAPRNALVLERNH